MEKLTKRKNASSKGKAQLKPKRRNEEVAYILTDGDGRNRKLLPNNPSQHSKIIYA